MTNDDWVLALDLGMQCTGFAYGNKDGPVKWGKYVAKTKNVSHAAKLYNFTKWLSTTIHSLPHKPTFVVIESPYYKNNIRTFGTLSQLMGVTIREIYRILKVDPIMMPPSQVKNIIKPKKGSNYYETKHNMVKKINQLFGLDLKYHKSNKNISDDDVGDALGLYEAFVRTNYDKTD